MKLPVSVEGDTTIVDADGEFVAECHASESAFGTQAEYDNAHRIAAAINADCSPPQIREGETNG